MVAHTFNPSTLQAETGGSLWVSGQPGLYIETWTQNKQTNKQLNYHVLTSPFMIFYKTEHRIKKFELLKNEKYKKHLYL